MHNISPLPPSSNPIIFHLSYCRSHTEDFLSLAFVYLSSSLSTKGSWSLKVVSHVSYLLKTHHWRPSSLGSKSKPRLIRHPITCSPHSLFSSYTFDFRIRCVNVSSVRLPPGNAQDEQDSVPKVLKHFCRILKEAHEPKMIRITV